MSFESIDPAIQRDMAGKSTEAQHLLDLVGPEQIRPNDSNDIESATATFRSKVAKAASDLRTVIGLYGVPSIIVPDIYGPEFGSINWEYIEAGNRVFEKFDHETSIVIAPEGRPLEFWNHVLMGIRNDQEKFKNPLNRPDSPIASGDDLVFQGFTLPEPWSKLVQEDNPRWSVSVVPNDDRFPIKGLGANNSYIPDSPMYINQKLYANEFGAKYGVDNPLSHLSIESYITLQALRLCERREALDANHETINNSGASWLKGGPNITGKWLQKRGKLLISRMGLAGDNVADIITRPVIGQETV
jgi:hypothetical protein